jgi:ribose transport system substrate-binding protein
LSDNHCCLAADYSFKMAGIDAYTWMVRLALCKGVAAAQGIDNTEPSHVTLPFTEDNISSDPRLAVRCDKSMPMDSIPSSMLTKGQQIKALARR